MDAPHERLASLRDLLRKADRQSPSEADQDFRRRCNVEDGAATSAEVVPTGSTIEDWSGTLHLVATAGERMLATEGRVHDLERELQRESESASEEIERLRAQISELQDHLTDALQRPEPCRGVASPPERSSSRP